MEKNLLKYVWRHSRPEQTWMFIVIMASMPTYFFFSLELPKLIVNSPIQGDGFENPGDTQNLLSISLCPLEKRSLVKRLCFLMVLTLSVSAISGFYRFSFYF